eukprot:c15801_g1_i3 orf=4-354(-)
MVPWERNWFVHEACYQNGWLRFMLSIFVKDDKLISNGGGTERMKGDHRPSSFKERTWILHVCLRLDPSHRKRKHSLRVPKAVGWQKSSVTTKEFHYGARNHTRDPHCSIGATRVQQ